MNNEPNLPIDKPNPVWITIVVLTALLMVVFMLYYGMQNMSNQTPEAAPAPQEKGAQPPAKPMGNGP